MDATTEPASAFSVTRTTTGIPTPFSHSPRIHRRNLQFANTKRKRIKMFRKIVVAALAASATAFAPTNFVGRRASPALFMADGVEEKVKGIIVSQLGVDADKVVPSATFVDDLGADSLDTVELIMAIEEEFDCEIPEEKAAEISTVQQVRMMRENAGCSTLIYHYLALSKNFPGYMIFIAFDRLSTTLRLSKMPHRRMLAGIVIESRLSNTFPLASTP